MSKPFDYSKWDNIELSDDEDDVHPNIDRESWFRLKHRSRVEREEKEEEDKKRITADMKKMELRMKEIQKMLDKMKDKADGDSDDDDDDDDLEDEEGLQAELAELRKNHSAQQDKLDEIEKNKKWNVDNMCHVVEEKTIITKSAGEQKFDEKGYALPEDHVAKNTQSQASNDDKEKEKNKDKEVQDKMEDCKISSDKQNPTKTTTTSTKSDNSTPSTTRPAGPKPGHEQHSTEVAMLSYVDFTDQYAPILEKFMTLSSLDQSKDYLLQNGSILLQENASSYLLLASLEDEMNGQHEKMKLTARQSQIVTNIAELAKTLKRHPGNVIVPFFQRLETPEYLASFMEGVNSFIEKVAARAVVKKKEMDEERQREAIAAAKQKLKGDDAEEYVETDLHALPKEERLGPGGLDPVEVFESLPEKMQEAFESRDVEELKKALMELDGAEAEYHMKRCVASGLWNE